MRNNLKQRIIQTDMFEDVPPTEVETASFEKVSELEKISLQKQSKKLFIENRELKEQSDRLLKRIQRLERQTSLLMSLLGEQNMQRVAL